MTTSGTRTVRAVHHAASLLRALECAPRPRGLSELARAVGLSTTSTLHLMRTLEIERLVAKDPEGRYHLSWGAYELGSAVIRSVDITRVVRAHLDRIADETGMATLLAIVDDRSVLYLDRGQSTRPLTMVANVGLRSPLHTNASGKLLLAHMPPSDVEAILGAGLQRRTSRTITDPAELVDSLSHIRKNGYATCWEEQEIGLNSVALPLRDYTGRVQAAMTVAGPAKQLTRRSVPRLLGLLRPEAVSASERLGYRPERADPSEGG